MLKRSLSLWVAAVLVCAWTLPSQASGRKPDDAEDKFPDYNRLEMRPKPRSSGDTSPSPEPTPPKNQPLNTPVNWTPDDDTPKPPPRAIPVPDNSSEPPLPEDMMGTLVPSTTSQN